MKVWIEKKTINEIDINFSLVSFDIIMIYK